MEIFRKKQKVIDKGRDCFFATQKKRLSESQFFKPAQKFQQLFNVCKCCLEVSLTTSQRQSDTDSYNGDLLLESSFFIRNKKLHKNVYVQHTKRQKINKL
jgi:hypothetical protein